MIGIVGGVGPYAGIDVLKNIFDSTIAHNDQDYIDTILYSKSSKIKDRTAFLMHEINENPAFNISKIILELENSGAKVVGIPCNTAHSERIFSVILQELEKHQSQIKVIHMINETIQFIENHFPKFKNIGVLSTNGTYKTKLYSDALLKNNLNPILVEEDIQKKYVHSAVYDSEYGIKSKSNPFHPQAKKNLNFAIDILKQKGAQAVILGCTEIPLVIKSNKINGLTTINPTNVLARCLIKSVYPQKLKPLK